MKKFIMAIGFAILFAISFNTLGAVPASASSSVPAACKGYYKVICASKARGNVMLIKRGQVVRSTSARFGGRASDGSGPWFTREGRFSVFYKNANAWSSAYHVYMPYFMAFSGGQGLHYSSEYANGYRYSHGCIGVRSRKFARYAFKWTPYGTSFVVTRY